MIIEGLNKASRKEFKAMLKDVKGIMFKRHGVNLEIVYVCLDLEKKVLAVKAVRNAISEIRKRIFNHITDDVFIEQFTKDELKFNSVKK